MFDEIVLMKDLTDEERMMFQNEMAASRKDPTVGVVLALFLGGVGAHRFYMGQTGLGILYLCFCWLFVPAVIALVECFLMPGRVRAHNSAAAQQIVLKLKVLRGGSASPAELTGERTKDTTSRVD